MRHNGTFSDKKFNQKLISLTIPIGLQSLLLASVAAADAIMLGRVDQNSMAAVSLASQVQFVMNMFIMAVTGTASILGAQYWGKQDKKTLDDIFNLILRLMTVIDVVFWAACLFVPQALMAFFTNDPELASIGCAYLRIAAWSYLITGFSQCYQAMMKVSEHAKRALYVSMLAVFSNIGLNSIFIYGLLGAPAMGARGAALATVISRILELGWCVISSYQNTFLHPHFKRMFRHNKLLNADFGKVSLPVLGAGLLWGVGFTSYTAIMGHMGADAAAANSMASVVRDLVCCLCNGVGSAAAIVLGNELGAGNMDRAKEYGYKLRAIGWIIGLLSMAIVLLVTPLVVHFMVLTDQARSYLTGMLVITSVYMIGRALNTVVINGVFDGGGDTKFDVYSLVVMMWCVAIPAALLGAFVFHWPVLVVYACTCIDEVGKIPWVMAHFKKHQWMQNLTREME